MTYRGHIKNGVAIIEDGVTLADGTPVRVEVDTNSGDFHQSKSGDELAREQGVQPISDLSHLAVDWPEQDSVDDLATLVREVRR